MNNMIEGYNQELSESLYKMLQSQKKDGDDR